MSNDDDDDDDRDGDDDEEDDEDDEDDEIDEHDEDVDACQRYIFILVQETKYLFQQGGFHQT